MKRVILVCFALLLVLTVAACNSDTPAQEEQTTAAAPAGNAPDFTVMDQDGKAVQLSDFAGKPVVLNFWATWCGYCKMEMPDFNRAYAECPEVVFLMVNVTDGVYETKEKADAYVKSEGFSFDIYYDVASSAVNAYGISGYPTTVFINASGDVVSKKVGAISYEVLLQGIGLITE